MPASISIAEIDRDPSVAACSLTARNGETIAFRPLVADAGAAMGVYFRGLRVLTCRRFAQTPFDQATADAVCASIDRGTTLRMVGDAGGRIVSYFLLNFAFDPREVERYTAAGVTLDVHADCRVAPCVADAYQNQQLGGVMLAHLLDLARRLGRRRVILWGGVQARNERARYFYLKHGFTDVGQFMATAPDGQHINNYDMMREL